MSDPNGFAGQQGLNTSGTELNKHAFLVEQMLGRMATVRMVKVVAVQGGGGALAKGGTVDVQPLVHMVDGLGNSTPHGNVLSLPYIRHQGGTTAFIMDPVVGDIGLALVSDRDTSAVRAAGGPANPGSARTFDLADGIYLGGVLNGVPTQFVQATADGLTITSPQNVKATVGELQVSISTSRVDLGKPGGAAVMTEAGPSSIVFAAIE